MQQCQMHKNSRFRAMTSSGGASCHMQTFAGHPIPAMIGGIGFAVLRTLTPSHHLAVLSHTA